MYIKKLVCFLAIVLFGFNTAVVLAEDAPPMGLNVSVFQVAPGHVPQFEGISAQFKAAADKIGSPGYIGYSSGIGNSGSYAFVSPFKSFAEMANPVDVIGQVYEGEELAKIGQAFQASVSDIDNYVIIPRPDLGIAAPKFESPPEIVLVIEVTVKTNMGPQFVDYIGKLKEATQATAPDLYYLAFQPGIGSGPVWRFVIPMNWVDLDKPGKPIPQRMMEHFGKRAGEKAYESGQDAIEGISFAVSRIRADLSHSNN